MVDPETGQVIERIAVGKRPRGVRLSPSGDQLFVALSGSPIAPPGVDESKLPPPDRSADGIGAVDLATHKLTRTYASGQDPEAFDVSLDGRTIFVSNEETSEMSVLDLASGTVTRRVPVGGEPEGVTLRPDGKEVYVTCEEDNEVFAVNTSTFAVTGRTKVGPRPRAVVVHGGREDGLRHFRERSLGRCDRYGDSQGCWNRISIPTTPALQRRPVQWER